MTSSRQRRQAQNHGFAASSYQKSAGELIQLVDKMRDAGAHHTIDLPTMVVCGNQSAGKSSLLERLTEVTLPKDNGTCTKCPTEVRMSSSSHDGRWHCDIKLRRDYCDATGATLPESSEVVFASLEGAEGQRQLVHYIKAAQRALLNPGQPPEGYVAVARAEAGGDHSDAEGPPPHDELKFTKNAVVLVLRGARADLTLIDLPGIIQSDEDNPGNVGLVKDMVTGFIKRGRAIIVAAISCKDDINNQAIVDLARSVDPTGGRTIGVLTKPDTIESGTHDQWVPILKGDKFSLSLGYYAVRNMSQTDLNSGMSLEAAVEQEAAFFATDSFWSGGEVAAAAGRFGITNLRSALSRYLVDLTKKELPAMSKAITDALRQVEDALSALPPEPSADPTLDLLHAIQALHTAVSAQLDGSAKDTHFLRLVRGKYKDLRNSDILSTAPLFVLDRWREVSCVVWPDENGNYDIENSRFWLSDGKPADSRRTIITLDDVKDVVEQHLVKELPGQLPAVVLTRLIQDNRQAWGRMILARLQEVADQLQGVLEAQVKATFQRFPRALSVVRGLVNQLHHDIMAETRSRLEDLMAMEETPLNIITLDDHYYLGSRDALLAEMGRMRLEQKGLRQPEEEMRNQIAGLLQSIGWEVRVEQLMALAYKNRPETNAAEEDWCNMIASTLAYFKVGCKRITDGVCMHINHHLLGSFGRKLHDLLMQQLILSTRGSSGSSTGGGGGASEGGVPPPAELMAEDGHVAAERQNLLAKQRRLQEAQRILNQL